MKFFSILCAFLLCFFTACSTNSASLALNSEQNTEILQDDEFSDFDSEYSAPSTIDPLSGYNRFMTAVNDKIYRYGLMPIFKAFDKIMPDPIQTGISNFFSNLMAPVRFVNNILQFKFLNAADELMSFAINSTIGIGGLFEVAQSKFGIERHQEDFGQTLGHWGVGSGFHIVLPLLGPSNVRDVFGLVGDFFTNPISYSQMIIGDDPFTGGYVSYSLAGTRLVSDGAKEPNAYEVLTRDAIDLYPFLKNAYEQRRNSLIKE